MDSLRPGVVEGDLVDLEQPGRPRAAESEPLGLEWCGHSFDPLQRWHIATATAELHSEGIGHPLQLVGHRNRCMIFAAEWSLLVEPAHPADHIAAGSSCMHSAAGGLPYSMRRTHSAQKRKHRFVLVVGIEVADILRMGLGWMGLAG